MNNLSVFIFKGRLCTIFFILLLTFNLTSQNRVEVIGQIKITGGSPGAGKVLTSDDVGLATWENPSGVTSQYAYIYNLAPQTVPIEVDLSFDSNGILTSGFSHTLNSSQITILNSGTYKVNFSVSGTESNQFALFLNGTVLSGGIYGSGAGTQQNNGQLIFLASPGDVVSLRNHSSAAAVTLASFIGGTEANVNASVIIEKL
ncbi:MAG: collagen-like protein [Saprospiraceae bacterium]|nr:collagen-like protein [Saprospiraceae bacterium]